MRISDYANPRQVVLITCRQGEKDNIITLAWHMPLSFEPMIYGIALGFTRYSYEMIKKSGVYVVNFMSLDYEREVLYIGKHSGSEYDKFKETSLESEEAAMIDCPVIKQASAFLECQVKEEIKTGDHALFAGEVMRAEKREDADRIFQISGSNFSTLK
ncbi:flavin reductase family protein [Patescibacteria group bacterium]|nr:flavin reductase family protein [Patescibacteria group bacterium]MBU1673953.1 flavin reductase family protein [Patescibacteria group bacterium]MBU1963947.1 flavin reductase family protein [Patescibacteria group bacterium]